VPNADVNLQPITKMVRLYLLKKFYGLQIGDLLMHKAVEISNAAGEKGIWLNVWKDNARAIRFYQKQGFEIVGEYEFVVTPTHSNPNWVMFLKY
jgi:ribosomal protein S18 acetylase RimI-like enzyme